jgi:hypothetical protein
MQEKAPYVLVLEDDVVFDNIPNLNRVINETVKNKDFELLSITRSTAEPKCYTPPRKDDYLAHFVLYNRERIPMILVKLFNIWLLTNKNDIWVLYGPGGYMYSGTECIQASYYFPTSNALGNMVNGSSAVCVFTDKSTENKPLHIMFNELTDNAIPLEKLVKTRDLFIRVYKIDESAEYIESVNLLGESERIYLPHRLVVNGTSEINKTELFKYALNQEGLVPQKLFEYDIIKKSLQPLL